MQNLDFILRLSPTTISLLVIKKIDFDDKKTNVFYKTLKNDKFKLINNENFEVNDLKSKIFGLLNDAKKELCINFIDSVIISYCFDCFKTSQQIYDLELSNLNLDNLIKDPKTVKINDFSLLNFYVNHHKKNNKKLNLYWIPTHDYENILNIFKTINCRIKHFIISQCFINFDNLVDSQQTIYIDIKQNTIKTLFYNGLGLVELYELQKFKNHLDIEATIQKISANLNVDVKTIKEVLRKNYYSEQQVIYLSLDENSLFNTKVIKIEDIKEKIKIHFNDLYKSILQELNQKINNQEYSIYIDSEYCLFNQIFNEFLKQQTTLKVVERKKINDNYHRGIYECLNDYIKTIIINS